MTLRYTLLSDGSSDRTLLPLLNWVLRENTATTFVGQWADFRRLLSPPSTLRTRVQRAIELYPCDLLFVHRDAENVTRTERVREIRAALGQNPPAVCVVPVRMQEAWFLFDEIALRDAAGKPRGREVLSLPPLRRVESLPDPKQLLHHALIHASGLHGRRRRRFPVRQRVYRLAELISDFAPLRVLIAFRALEAELRGVLRGQGWT